MRSVILFGGGDAGGLLITPNGVRPIPPFDPEIRLTLKSASSLINSLAITGEGSIKTKKAKLCASLANLSIEQVEQAVGELSGETALVYQDDDGGFYCGSTGKPPIPIPWPPSIVPSLPELLSAGLIERDLVELLQTAKANKIPYTTVFEDPASAAKKLGVTVSDKTASDLLVLAPSKLSERKDPTDREVLAFFHKVADDGRFLGDWLVKPAEVAAHLKIQLSEEALERIVTGGALHAFGARLGPNAFADIGVCVAVVTGADVVIIAVVALSSREIGDIVRDRSGIAKI
jgi:hypothetical protein